MFAREDRERDTTYLFLVIIDLLISLRKAVQSGGFNFLNILLRPRSYHPCFHDLNPNFLHRPNIHLAHIRDSSVKMKVLDARPPNTRAILSFS